MYRLGVCTGKIYDEFQMFDMKECGQIITDAQLADKAFIRQRRIENTSRCIRCRYCPESRRFMPNG